MKRRFRAFTQLELLVVISIMAVLIALLVPALGRARTQAKVVRCATQVRSIGLALLVYVDDEGTFPELNNQANDGTYPYNYMIWDGEDFRENFGPLARPEGTHKIIEDFYCPVQQDPFHSQATPENPWPVKDRIETRAGYGRRYGLSGKSLSQLKGTIAILSDILHLPDVIKTGHKTGVNVGYSDGHAQWYQDHGLLTDNDLSKPFSEFDNPIMEDIWEALDQAR